MKNSTDGILELFSIQLKPGTGDLFNRLYIDHSLPLQKRWNVDLLAFGPSLHDKDSYFVVRQYKNLEDRQRSQDAFYGSEEWMQGPREAILALIKNYTTVIIPANDALLEGLKIIGYSHGKDF